MTPEEARALIELIDADPNAALSLHRFRWEVGRFGKWTSEDERDYAEQLERKRRLWLLAYPPDGMPF